MSLPLTSANYNTDSQLRFIIEPVTLTTASQVIIDASMDPQLLSIVITNFSALDCDATMTDGAGNEIIPGSTFAAKRSQYVDFGGLYGGIRLAQGIKAYASANNSIKLWISAKKS